jgi:hypothetical protein
MAWGSEDARDRKDSTSIGLYSLAWGVLSLLLSLSLLLLFSLLDQSASWRSTLSVTFHWPSRSEKKRS